MEKLGESEHRQAGYDVRTRSTVKTSSAETLETD